MGLGNVLKAVGVGFSVTYVLRGLRQMGGAFLDFDANMTESLAIMGDVSAGMRTKMEEAAKSVAKTTTFSAAEAAQSYFFLASAGLDAKQSIAALPQVSKFAQAGMFDMARATDLATDAQSALGMTIDDAQENLVNLTRVTDVLVKANTLANASVEQFSTALTNKAGAALKIVGKEIEEGVAVLAAFADQGLKGAEAGTALNIVFRDMQTKALRNKKAFAELDVTVFDVAGEMRNIADVIGDLEGALAGMSDEQKKATLMQLGFADKSVIFIQTILGQSEAIREYEGELRNAAGITEEVASKQLESFKAQIKLTTDSLKVMIIELVNTVMPMFGLKGGLADVRFALERAEWWIKGNTEAIATWVNVITRSVSLAIQGFDLFVTSIASTFKTAGDILGNFAALTLGVATEDKWLIKTAWDELKKDIVADTQPIRDALTATSEDLIAVAEAIGKVRGAQPVRRPQAPGPQPSEEPFDPFANTVWGPPVYEGFGADFGLRLPDPKSIKLMVEPFIRTATKETLDMLTEMGGVIESGLEETIGDAIFNGLEAAFDTGSLVGFFEHFGKTLLAGFGDILVQLGKILIQYGLTMEALRPFLMNIFTAGPAAIAAGVALIALGSAFSSIVSSGGGAGRGTATAGAFREPNFGFAQQQADISRTTISMGSSPTVQPRPAVNNYFTIIGPDDATAQRGIITLINKGLRRGLVLSP